MAVYGNGVTYVLPSLNAPIQKLRLTDAIVRRLELPPGRADLIVWDTELSGFALRIRATGKTWIVVYRPIGTGRSVNPKKMKIGTTETIRTTTEARHLARVTLGRIAAGADPLAERAAAKVADKAKLSDLIDTYEEELKRRQYVGAELHTRNLRTKMRHLLARDIRTIDGHEYAAVIARLEKDGWPGAAKDFRARCRAFLGWCVAKAQVLQANPLAGHRKERATRADRVAKAEHGRALSDAEIVKVWLAADSTTVNGRLLRFWLLTGCRRGEGAGLTWAMLDEKAKLIRLPAVFVKQGRGHDVPIASALARLLDACPRDARSDLVFASPRTGGLISGWTQITEKANKVSGIVFHIHDLRRTFRTGLSRLGIDTETAELAIGHARAELLQIYDRDRGENRLRAAFEAWAEHVEKIVAAADAKADRMEGVFA